MNIKIQHKTQLKDFNCCYTMIFLCDKFKFDLQSRFCTGTLPSLIVGSGDHFAVFEIFALWYHLMMIPCVRIFWKNSAPVVND